MSYKAGDRVVIIVDRNILRDDKELVGTTFTIKKVVIDRDGDMEIYKEGDKSYFVEEEIILEEIYNSGLYQAMKESDN